MVKEYITTNVLAAIRGISSRAVRKSISLNHYVARKNGKSYEILISSLEPYIQEKIKKNYVISEESDFYVSESERKIALAKFDLVQAFRKYRLTKKSTGIKDFLIIYRTNIKYVYIYDLLGNVAMGTLYRWDKTLKDNNDNWNSLVNKYVGHTIPTALSPAEEKTFMSLLLNSNQLNINKAMNLTKHILSERGITKFASATAYRRYIEKYKKEHYDVWIFAREGAKALRDKVVPYIERDISKLEVGDVIIGDGHRLAFQVINPFDGRPCRPTLVAYQDWKSGALVGFEIMLEENTQCIASALRNAIINLGRIPKYVYQDNGKAFRGKYFINTDGLMGIFVKLGITPVFAKPYNAKAKPIERFFREMQDSFERLLPSFVGSDINNKPAYLKRNEKFHKENHNDYIPTIEGITELVNKWLCFHYSQPCPNVEGKTIGEVLESGRFHSGLDISKLDDLMMVAEIKRIGRNGIRFLKADYYDDCMYGLRIDVIIKYSLFDLSQIKVFTTMGKFLCIAKRLEPVNPLANYIGDAKDMEDLKQKLKQQKQLEKQTIKSYISEIKKTQNLLPVFDNHEDLEEYKSTEEKRLIEAIIKDAEISRTKIKFSNNFERYEYLKNKPDITSEETEWLKNYEDSTEFQLIYGQDMEEIK